MRTRTRRTVFAAALGLGLSAQARAASDPGTWRDLNAWGSDPLRDKYEELFDRKYPARSYDWFNRSHPFEDVQNFNREFELRAAGVSQRVEEAGGQVALIVDWPGSAALALDVSVDGGLVRLKPAPAAAESSGKYRFRAANAQQLETPVPPHAKEGSAKVTRAGDSIRVAFDRD